MTRRTALTIGIAGVILILLVVWELLSSRPLPAVKVGASAPNIQAETIQGQTFRLADYNGKPVFLDFFATWCGPCQQEEPALNAFTQSTRGKLQVVLVDRNDSRTLIQNFIQKYQVPSNAIVLYNHPDKVSSIFSVTGQPEGVFINSQGVVTAHTEGPLTQQQMTQLARKAGMR